ncbi:MAG: hypothetical protein GC164_07045 [Phycisphaera sp.]|nr:hypothetical protein [Phycisphaera sp.]
MQCNIDAKGKFVRLVSGIAVTLGAIVFAVLAWTGVLTGTWPWVVAGALFVSGAFQVYEGWCSWCILRAMGFKTPI